MSRDSRREKRFQIQESLGAFPCAHCGQIVSMTAPGTRHRNHCPHCLWSLHVDLRSGDRRSGCRGEMEPVGIEVRYDDEWALLHRCRACGLIRANRLAGDDNALVLISLALRPLARPPFPLDLVARSGGILPEGQP